MRKGRRKSIFVFFAVSVVTVRILLGFCPKLEGAVKNGGGEETGWFIDMSRFSKSAHGTLNCEECHGAMDDRPGGHPVPGSTWSLRDAPQARYDYGRCRKCHRESFERYTKGLHAETLIRQKADPARRSADLALEKQAPTCGHCHSSHYQRARQDRLTVGRNMVSTCGRCHQPQKETYLKGFHGKTAVNLGDVSSAYCTDCHGAHQCLSLKDRNAALEACLRCHPKADISFAGFIIHPSPGKGDPEKEKAVRIIGAVTTVMAVLVALTVGFFYGHSLLWLLREIQEKLRRRRP